MTIVIGLHTGSVWLRLEDMKRLTGVAVTGRGAHTAADAATAVVVVVVVAVIVIVVVYNVSVLASGQTVRSADPTDMWIVSKCPTGCADDRRVCVCVCGGGRERERVYVFVCVRER